MVKYTQNRRGERGLQLKGCETIMQMQTRRSGEAGEMLRFIPEATLFN